MEHLFETPARARVLRALALTDVPRSVRAVSKAAGISHTAGGAVLRELEAMGLVTSGRVGRAIAFRLQRDNVYVRRMLLPAIEAEAEIIDELCSELVSTFGDSALSLILFGSYAHGEQDEASDIDVLAIAADERRKQQLEGAAWKSHSRFWSVYGASLTLLVYTMADVRERLDPSVSAFRTELESTGIILHGLGPREWESSGTQDQDARGEHS